MNAINTPSNQPNESGAVTQAVDVVIMDESVNKEITLMSVNGLTAKVLPNELLSIRESQVTAGKGIGLSNQQIASVLHMAFDTVKTHLKNVYQKLEVNNACAAVSMAIADGIIEVSKEAKNPGTFRTWILCYALFVMSLIFPAASPDGYINDSYEQTAAIDTNRRGGSKTSNRGAKAARASRTSRTKESFNGGGVNV